MKVFVLNGWAASEHAWDLCAFRRDRVFGYIEQLDALPEAALRGESAAVLVGWSMGGSGALRLAVRFPEKVAGLVLVAATPRMMGLAIFPQPINPNVNFLSIHKPPKITVRNYQLAVSN